MKKTLYFSCMFPQKPSPLMHRLLHIMFRHINIDKGTSNQLRSLAKDGVIIYTTKYHSHFDFILYYYCFRKARLPYPRIGFDINMSMYLPIGELTRILRSYASSFLKNGRLPSPYDSGFYKDAILKKIPGIIPLINPKGFSRYFIGSKKEPLDYVIEIQKEIDLPIFLIPVLILYRYKPERMGSKISEILFGFRDKPSILTKVAIFFKYYRKAFIDIGNPINLKEYIYEMGLPLQQISTLLKQELIDKIDAQKRAALGPVIKSRQQIKELVLRDEKINYVIQEMSKGNKKKEKELKKKAEEYFEEMAADFSVTYATLFHASLTWLWKKSFQGIDILDKEFSQIRQWAKKGLPIVYVPSHKSHVDYLILNYLLFDKHIYPPRIAAGTNLAFWPMGHIFRKCGAFFIRRSFKGAKLYTLVFDRYIKLLLQEGYPIEFFIEGGRSRSGKLELPKLGFLSILINAWKDGYCKDIIFIPVSITYDKVVEERSYIKEIKGKEKEPESFKQVLKGRRILKQRYGRIYVRFSSPVSLKEYHNRGYSSEKLAFDLVRSINNVTVVTPTSFVSIPIMTKHRKGFYLFEINHTCNIILDFLQKNGAPLVNAIIENLEDTIKKTLSLFKQDDLLIQLENQSQENVFYCLNEKKSFELSYYKNNIIHYFLPYAFVAISLLVSTEETKDIKMIKKDFLFLRDLFRYEFIYDDEVEEEMVKAIKYFYNMKFIVKDNHDFRVTRSGIENLPIWSELIRTYLESYWIVAKVIGKDEGKRIKEKELLKRAKNEGENLYDLKIIKHLESISYLTFRNAIRYIRENIPPENILDFSQFLYSLINRLPS